MKDIAVNLSVLVHSLELLSKILSRIEELNKSENELDAIGTEETWTLV